MAPRGAKRAASKAAGGAHKKAGAAVASKCNKIAATIRGAESVPAPVRSMLCDSLGRTFCTYKENRHPFQVKVSDLVGKILKEVESQLQTTISEAQQNKAALEKDASPLTQANDAAVAASDAAAKALSDSKAAVASSKAALKDAKSALHALEAQAKASEAEAAATAAKKGKLEALAAGTITPIREGTQHGATAGKHVGSVIGSSVDPEFLVCITRTFSKKASTWGTFDHIVDKKLGEELQKSLTSLDAELQSSASQKEAQAAEIEKQKAAIVACEEKVKATDEACNNAATAAKEAEAAAKAAGASLKQHEPAIKKATDACKHAEDALAAFTSGALAAYTEVEALTAPPAPEPEAEVAAPAPLEQVMEPAPPAATQSASPSILPSPRVMMTRAVSAVAGLASSPRVAPSASPRIA